MDITKYGLSENPFQYLTAMPHEVDGEPVIWAGMPDLYMKINNKYKDLINNRPRQVILNWGPYGGGKTFAAHYFINKYKGNNLKIEQSYIRSPKQGNKASSEFYKTILSNISFRKIRTQIKRLIDLMGEEELFDFLQSKIRNEEIVEAILKISEDDQNTKTLMNRFVYEGLTNTELKKIGLAKNIDWGTESIAFLSGIIYCFIGDQNHYKGRFVLWIDEMEDMIYYSQKEYRLFSQTLRDLIDTLNQYFTIFFNFTLAESEESTIQLLLGEALWSRINSKIRFKELTVEDALLYIKEKIKAAKSDNSKDEYHPFSEEKLKFILSMIPQESLTPREINRYCSGILNFGLNKGSDIIDDTLISDYFNSLDEDF